MRAEPVHRNAWVRDIVARASSVQERLSGAYLSAEAPGDETRIQARLQKWCRAVARGDWGQFERRLSCDGLNRQTVRWALGTVRPASGQPLAAWAQTLNRISDFGFRISDLENLKSRICNPSAAPSALLRARLRTGPQSPIPFEDLLLPFVAVARQRLLSRPDASYQLLPETCQVALERQFLNRLSFASARTFLLNFSVFKTLAEAETKPPENRLYRAFVTHHLQDGYQELFTNYSVLARLLATQTDLWVETTVEFLKRLQADWPIIQQVGNGANHQSPITNYQLPITNLTPGLSDPHHGGRMAMVVEFDNGLKLVYKPRDVGMEVAYNALLRWLNAHGLSPTLKPLRVLNRGTHGWIEFARRRPCQNAAEARDYYRRVGMLVALSYSLRGADYHSENLIACGEHPVMVDHEMLFQATFPDPRRRSAQAAAQRLLDCSVLTTGLLNVWATGAKGEAYDVSAIGGVGTRTIRRRVWKHVNTDRMKRVWEEVRLEAIDRENVPVLQGKPLSPGDYLTEMESGFCRMYRFLLAHREALLAPDGPLAAFEGQANRITFRKTSLYWDLLYTTTAPRHMHTGVDRSIQLDLLSRAFLRDDGLQARWPIVGAEQTALAQMDIPHFVTRTDSRSLASGGQTILENVFAEPAYQATRAHLARLSEADLARQLGLMRAIFKANEPERATEQPRAPSASLSPVEGEASEIKQRFRQHALQIAQILQHHAIRTTDEATWLRLDTHERTGAPDLAPLGYELYGGNLGVALFLAAVADPSTALHPGSGERPGRSLTVGPAYRDLALAAIQPLRRELHDPTGSPLPVLTNLGAGSGLGGVIYALVRIAGFLGEPALLHDAWRAAALVTPELVAADQHFDVVAGAAGGILGLLALYRASSDPATLRRACALGKHLLANRVTGEAGCRAWPTHNGKPMAGFAHGTAGIAYALLRLEAATKDGVFLRAAREAIAYERSIFNAEAGNWPDLSVSTPEKPSFTVAWCHGAPGIGLARLGGLEVLDTDDVRADVDVALATTQRCGVGGRLDHLCCGLMGRIELLLSAEVQLSRPALYRKALAWGHYLAVQADQTGEYNLLYPQACAPGFFKGLAGIGYGFLRLAYPGQLPSVLLWE